MSLSINVGLSRKASKNFQSTGVSISIAAELDSALLAKPIELQAEINSLYAQANEALERQASLRASHIRLSEQDEGCDGHAAGNNRSPHYPVHGNGHQNGNRIFRLSTAQSRAIAAIANRNNFDAEIFSREDFGVGVQELSMQQASKLIDRLKAEAAAAGNGTFR